MPPGLQSRYTADEIRRIRDVYDRWMAAMRERSRSVKAYEVAKAERKNGLDRFRALRAERARLLRTLLLHPDMFSRIGRGKLGKKPRSA